LAYDGSKTSDAAIKKIAQSPLLRNLPGHIVMVADDKQKNEQSLSQACELLNSSGHEVQAHLIQGHVVESLMAFQERQNIEMKVMGAYGHSRIREFIVGSHTTEMLASSTVPVLILR